MVTFRCFDRRHYPWISTPSTRLTLALGRPFTRCVSSPYPRISAFIRGSSVSSYSSPFVCIRGLHAPISRFNEICKGSQGSTDTIGSDIQLFDRKIQSIDPEGRVPKILSAYCIPAAKGGKQDLFSSQFEGIDRHLIRSGIRLVRFHRFHAEIVFKRAFQFGALDPRSEHRRRQ